MLAAVLTNGGGLLVARTEAQIRESDEAAKTPAVDKQAAGAGGLAGHPEVKAPDQETIAIASHSTEVGVDQDAPKRQCKSSAHTLPTDMPAPASEEEVEARLARSSVLLFMKGSPERPRCRFSRAAVEVLRAHHIEFDSIDVLEEPAFRRAMASRWPTFPQLWAEGVLLGGCDELRELAKRGELIDAIRSSTARERASLELLFKLGGSWARTQPQASIVATAVASDVVASDVVAVVS